MQYNLQGQLSDILRSVNYFAPELILSFTFLLSIFVHLFSRRRSRHMTEFTVLSGLLVTLYFTLEQLRISDLRPPTSVSISLFGGMLQIAKKVVIFKLIFLFSSILFFAFSTYHKKIKYAEKGSGEFFILLPLFVLGLNLMAMSSHLLMMYLSLEMVSILSYIYVAYISNDQRSSESAMKYALFGAVSSAIMLYGISWIYGFTGSLDLHDGKFLAELSKVPSFASSLALFLVLAGFIYKISAVPFHFYTPDVYEGAPTPVVAFLSVGPKAAGLAVLYHFIGVFTFPFEGYHLVWPNFNWEKVIIVLSIITMTVGNFSALAQTHVKRLLAYSSIAHTGFLLMALAVFNDLSDVSLFYYLIVYVIMNFGAFIVAGILEEKYHAGTLNDYKGLGAYAPFITVCLIVFLASLIGLPPTGGFTGKFLLFSAVWKSYTASGSVWLLYLLIAGVINTVISLFFYFKIPLYLFFRKSETERVVYRFGKLSFILLLLAAAVLLIGIFPSVLTEVLR